MFEPIGQCPNLHLLRFHSLLIAVHWQNFALEQFQTISKACETIVKDHGQVSSLVLMQGNFSLMLDSDGRREGAVLTKLWAPSNTGQALVLPAEGFRASIARSMLAGVNLLARSTVPQKVFQSSTDAIEWLTTLPGQPAEVAVSGFGMWDHLQPVVERLDAEYHARREQHAE